MSQFVPSRVVQRIMDSPRSALRLHAQGKISLAAGEPDFATPRPIIDAAIEALNAGYTRYPEFSGDLELRSKIAERVTAVRGSPCRPEEVVVTHGSTGGLAAAVFATVNPGDRVVIPEPTYSLYAELVKAAGGTPEAIPCRSDHHLDIDAICRAAQGAPLVILCSPCNPTGAVYTRQELLALSDGLARSNALLLVDEVYDRIIYPGVEFTSTLAIPQLANRLLYVQSFSKTFAMTGWRVGYLVAPPEILPWIARMHRSLTGPLNATVQRAALRALMDDGTLVRPMLEAYTKRRELTLDRLARIRGVTVRPPDGTFFTFVRYASSVPSLALTQQLAEAGVLVRAGSEFGAAGEHHLRLSFATSDENITEGLRRLERVLHSL